MMRQTPFAITLYGRPGCHLCDEVESRIRRVGQEIPIRLQVVDIQSDPRLEEKYMFTIPVVEVDGEETFVSINGIMTEEELMDELRRRIGSQSR
jgi:glutaredoxin